MQAWENVEEHLVLPVWSVRQDFLVEQMRGQAYGPEVMDQGEAEFGREVPDVLPGAAGALDEALVQVILARLDTGVGTVTREDVRDEPEFARQWEALTRAVGGDEDLAWMLMMRWLFMDSRSMAEAARAASEGQCG